MDFNGDGAGILRHGVLAPRLVPISQASTFPGFCHKHDSDVFAPLETQPFSATQEQIFLLGYRALCKEIHERQVWVNVARLTPDWDDIAAKQPVPLSPNESTDESISRFQEVLSIYFRFKSAYDDVLVTNDYSQLACYVVNVDQCPDILFSACLVPIFDFSGRYIVTGLDIQNAELMTISTIPTDTGGAFVFSWLNEAVSCVRFIHSLHSLADDQVPHAIIRLAFFSFKNMYGNPKWWESLPASTKKDLIERRYEGMYPDPRQPDHVLARRYLDNGIRTVSWKVTSCQTNVKGISTL